MAEWVGNRLYVRGAEEELVRFWKRAHGSDDEDKRVLDFGAHAPSPAGLKDEALRDWRRTNWGAETGACDVELEDGERNVLSYRFRTIESPPEQWLEAVAKEHPDLSFDLIYRDELKRFAGRTAWEGGELTAYDWHDPDEVEEEPVEIAPPVQAMGGTVVLDEPGTYDEPARFVAGCFQAWLEEEAEGDEVAESGCLIDFNLWIYDAGDPEEAGEWELLIGPLTNHEVGKLDESRGAWLQETTTQAFQTARKMLEDSFLADNPGSLLETEVMLRFFPPEAQGFFDQRG